MPPALYFYKQTGVCARVCGTSLTQAHFSSDLSFFKKIPNNRIIHSFFSNFLLFQFFFPTVSRKELSQSFPDAMQLPRRLIVYVVEETHTNVWVHISHKWELKVPFICPNTFHRAHFGKLYIYTNDASCLFKYFQKPSSTIIFDRNPRPTHETSVS